MPKKVLIIDDELDLLKFVAFRLEKSGYKVLVALDSQEAFTLMKRVIPDLILLDMRLPGLNGYEICRKIKIDETLKNIPIILFTASILCDTPENVRQAGADDCIIKPFEAKELLNKVKRFIG